MYSFDLSLQEPSLIFDRQLSESVTCIRHGRIVQGGGDDGNMSDLLVSTYSGKIISFSCASDEEVLSFFKPPPPFFF